MKEYIAKARVRYGETDKMGVVYHPNYFVYFEFGRTELMRATGLPYSDMEKQDSNLVVVEAHCKYIAGAVYDEEITIATHVAEIAKAKIQFNYKIRGKDDRILAEGYTVLACLDKNKKVARLPDSISSKLARYV
ncbi:acyl-CoA thioesterase [Candidatus Peregrinibacteria bacterium]|nr:acyl-CoA thioesterase [Candidatus Peregrinibacteria bacterium]